MNYIEIVSAVVISLVGNGLLSKYLLQKLKAQQDGKLVTLRTDLERDTRRLQTILDHTVLVHRVQFEAEFRALRIIWKRIVELRGRMAAVRPIASFTSGDPEKDQEALEKRFIAFSKSLDDAKDAILANEPFITEEIFQELFQKLLMAAQAEQINVRLNITKPKGSDWWDKGEKNNGDLQISVNKLSAMIRARLKELSVTIK